MAFLINFSFHDVISHKMVGWNQVAFCHNLLYTCILLLCYHLLLQIYICHDDDIEQIALVMYDCLNCLITLLKL